MRRFAIGLLILALLTAAPVFADTILFGFSDDVYSGVNAPTNVVSLVVNFTNNVTHASGSATLTTGDTLINSSGSLDQGWWSNNDQNPGVSNYSAGVRNGAICPANPQPSDAESCYRDFFSFNLTAGNKLDPTNDTITGATLEMYRFQGSCYNAVFPSLPTIGCPSLQALLTLRQVSTDASILNSFQGDGSPDGTDFPFNDIGAGNAYGSAILNTYGPTDTQLMINLNSSTFLTAINNQLHAGNVTDPNNPLMGDDFFSIGGTVDPYPPQTSTVPEPASFLLLGSGLSGIALMLKRRHK